MVQVITSRVLRLWPQAAESIYSRPLLDVYIEANFLEVIFICSLEIYGLSLLPSCYKIHAVLLTCKSDVVSENETAKEHIEQQTDKAMHLTHYLKGT